MKAIVLAAGLGERVRPLTDRTPKPMLPIGGRPLIHYPLAMLKRAGITEVVINVHHLAGQIQKGLRDGSSLGLEITYSPEPVLFGTGGALNPLRDYFGDETFVLANSDTILDLDLAAMIRFHRDRGAIATLGLFQTARVENYGPLQVDSDSRVRRMRLLKSRNPLAFDDYPPELNGVDAAALRSLMYCGVIVAEVGVFELMPKAPPWALMMGLFGPMVKNGLPVFGFVHDGYFGTVDDVPSYQALRREFEVSPPHFKHLDFTTTGS